MEKEAKQNPEIGRISGHALENAMSRWGIKTLAEARQFIIDRYKEATEVIDDGEKDFHILHFKSGDARIVAEFREGSGQVELVTIKRRDRFERRNFGQIRWRDKRK